MAFLGGIALIFFRELGHARLSHSLINHTVYIGLDKILAARGVKTDEAKLDQLKAENRKPRRF